jgi:hypothetical protein
MRWKRTRIKLLRNGEETNIDDKFSITRVAIQVQRGNKGSYVATSPPPTTFLSAERKAESL